MGTSSRTLVCAFLTGIEDLVEFIAKDTGSSLFYLNGFSRLSSERRAFVVTAAMVSRVSEAAMQELLADARVAQTYGALWEALSEDMLWLLTLDDYVWQQLAVVADIPSEELRSNCIAGAHVSFHDFWRRALDPASE